MLSQALTVSMNGLANRHQITRLEIIDTRHRRHWSASAKVPIVEESLLAPAVMSAKARRHRTSNQLGFASMFGPGTWLSGPSLSLKGSTVQLLENRRAAGKPTERLWN